MSATVNDIVKIMDSIAPRNLAEEWDNAGFLIGRGMIFGSAPQTLVIARTAATAAAAV